MRLSPRIKFKHLVVFIFLVLLLFSLPPDFFKEFFFSLSDNLLVLNPSLVHKRINTLKKEKLLLSLKVKELEHYAEENQKLKKALGFKEREKANLIVTEIVGFDPSSWRRIIFVKGGTHLEIKKGMYVIDEDGFLVGRVIGVNRNYAQVILLNDPDFSLPVFVGENSFGLLKGGLEGIKVLYVENAEEIKPKDRVWIKVPKIAFPLFIGEIERLNRNEGDLFWDLKLKPYAKSILRRKVFIVQWEQN